MKFAEKASKKVVENMRLGIEIQEIFLWM